MRDIEAVSGSLAPLLRGSLSRLYQARKNELSGELIRISESLSAAKNVQSCIAGIVKAGAILTESSGSVIRIDEKGALRVKAFFTAAMPGIETISTPNDLPFAEEAFRTGRPVVNNHLELSPGKGGCPARHSVLCVPFSDGSGRRGVLSLFDRKTGDGPAPYTRLEREITRALLRVALMSLHNISNESEVREISRSLEWRLRELTLLHQISRAVLDRRDVNEVLRSLLEAVTNLEGFGFDRAFLFKHDVEKRSVTGVVGVEALPVTEAQTDLRRGEPPRIVPHKDVDDVVLNLMVKLEPEGDVLSRTVLERRSFRIRLPKDRELVGSDVIHHLGNVQAFATAPLLSEDKVLGVIWVDNFRTRRPIRLEDFQLLKTAAAQAGLAVERSVQAEALDLLNSQILDLQNRLIQWEKMAALGEMAASVAHDIRNPLVSIGGFTRRLKKMLPDDNRGRKYAEIIIQEVDRLEWTLDNVMSYARSYGIVDMKQVQLYSLLSECAELFSENFKKKKVTLKRQFEREIPEVSLDERQIKQAVINILFNAGEAVPENSEVRLSAHLQETDHGSYVIIRVSDEGEGIDPQNLDRVFQPFFTTKGTGTGLGLAIAQRAVSGHGGEIRVDNRYGEGVTFSICLPVAQNAGKEE
jgi:signal transduction histidine kinase